MHASLLPENLRYGDSLLPPPADLTRGVLGGARGENLLDAPKCLAWAEQMVRWPRRRAAGLSARVELLEAPRWFAGRDSRTARAVPKPRTSPISRCSLARPNV